jgi:ABC-2 type transport system permease protein
LRKYLRLYLKFAAQSLKVLMEYRTDFIIGLSGFLVTQATGIILLYIVFQRIPKLNGWNYNDILFVYSFAQLPRGFDHLFTDNLWLLSGRIISRGEFDRYLLKPINPLFHVIAERFQPDAFGELIVGFSLMTYSVIKLNVNLNFINVSLFILMVICGTIIYTSIKLFFASFAFWVKNSQSILFVNYSLSDFSKYPISIYSKPIRVILTFVMPFAFTAYFPAAFFINKASIIIGIGGTIIATIISSLIAYYTWCKGISNYESAGS